MNEDDLIRCADSLFKERDGPDKAVEIYLYVLEKQPFNVELLLKTAGSIYSCDDWGERTEEGYEKQLLSIQLAERAVELEPENATTHAGLAEIVSLWGENNRDYSQRAAREYKRALELDPENIWASIGVARARRYLNVTPDQAIEKLERALAAHCDEVEPDLLELLSELGGLYIEKGNDERALSVFEFALSKVTPDKRMEPYRKGLPRTIARLKKRLRKQRRQIKA